MLVIRRSMVLAAVLAALFVAPSAAQAAPKYLGSGQLVNMRAPGATTTARCTVAAVGTDRFGNSVALLAGHCGTVGTVLLDEQMQQLGTFATQRTYRGWLPGIFKGALEYNQLDYAFVKLNPDVVARDFAPSPVNVKSVVAPAYNQFPVCKFGYGIGNVGERCGFTNSIRPLEFESTAFVSFGDSGGPVYVYGTKLIGIVSRPSGLPWASPAIMTRADAAIADATANGFVGAGFVPLA